VELPDGSGMSFERRDFLRLGAAASAAAGIAGTTGCAPEKEEILPRPDRPEEARVGLALNYATTCFACSAQCGVLARAREGRVVKIEGNPDHPVNRGTLCARGQASVLDLYDADRLRSSMLLSRSKVPELAVSNDVIDEKITAALAGTKEKKPRIRVLTGALSGSAMLALVDDFVDLFPGSDHVAWEPLGPIAETIAEAAKRCYGQRTVPQYRIGMADVIVGFGAEFLDAGLSPMQYSRGFGARRHPEHRHGMSKFWAFEGRMSLTGSNADRRIKVRSSHLADVALAVARAIIVDRRVGPLAEHTAIADALKDYEAEAVAARVGVPAEAISTTAEMLAKTAGRSLVIGGGSASTGASGLALEIAINLINSTLQNDGRSVFHQRASFLSSTSHAQFAKLVHDMRSGKVDVLIVAGANPVFAAPPVLGFEEAMTHVPLIVDIADRLDETARSSDLACAGAHFLECWSDAAPSVGVAAVAQPAMRPVGAMRGLGDCLVAWADKVFGPAAGRLATVAKQATEKDAVPSPTYHYIRDHWRRHFYPMTSGVKDFDTFWKDLLHAGMLIPQITDPGERERPLIGSAFPLPKGEPPVAGELELALYAPVGMYDGRQGNNAWLLEYPDPVTRVTWDCTVGLSRRRMKEMKLRSGDLCEVKVGDWKLRMPAVEIPGQHDDVASVPLGWGRPHAGLVGGGVGQNGYHLLVPGLLGPQFTGQGVSVRKLGAHVALAIPQGEMTIDLGLRPLIPYTEMSKYRQDPASGTERPKGEWSIWPGHAYPETRWAMTVDLSRCIGCGACTIACQAENNIPTAGRKGVINGREMHWLRVDRYHAMPTPRSAKNREEVRAAAERREALKKDDSWLDDPQVVYQPLMCQHCENAPCETVCPVGATNHSTDGLNVQSYNRCVGTRYCSNNCPFKARRFNWMDYSKDKDNFLARIFAPELPKITAMNSRWPLPLKNNPEVTVRSRGVMEKCTFCVQRIEVGRGLAKDEDRKLRDGDVVPACMQTCPTQAIRFGNMVDEGSEVARLRKSKRALTMLDEQKLGCSVTYLTKVRNDES
jgi:molybdopterin-containing oxidoreductase family iron-sulfur binding subunit